MFFIKKTIRWSSAFAIGLVLFANILTDQAQAARGAPGSSEFGFGASVYLEGPYLNEAVYLAANLQLDWLAIDIPWMNYMPSQDSRVQFGLLDQVMQTAQDHKMPVLARLTAPPTWAVTPTGPDPASAARFISELTDRYSGTLQAVEVFPGANTRAGWGAPPDAQSYAELFRTVSVQPKNSNKPVIFVAGGLKPVLETSPDEAIQDLVFLAQLYQVGSRDFMPVISMQLDDLTGAPLALPSSSEPRMLRHYEEVRQVMVAHQHNQGLLWITRLSAPSGKINSIDQSWQSQQQQAEWLLQAYLQMRSQLYIGVAVLDSLNPAALHPPEATQRAMIQNNTSYHPFYKKLQAVITANSHSYSNNQPVGKPKDGALSKKRPTTPGKP